MVIFAIEAHRLGIDVPIDIEPGLVADRIEDKDDAIVAVDQPRDGFDRLRPMLRIDRAIVDRSDHVRQIIGLNGFALHR
jgi:hypothetical protein